MTIPENILPTSTFTCGPSQGHPDIRQRSLADIPFERSHRSPDITKGGLINDTANRLREFMGLDNSYTVVFFHGGATPALDAIAWNLTTDSIAGLRFGAFSELWGKKISRVLPASVDQRFLDAGDKPFPAGELDMSSSLALLTPNETSTGVAIPDDYLVEAYRRASDNTVVAWDCTSCAGGRQLPRNACDVMVFSLQKCFGCPGGTGVIIMNEKAVRRQAEVVADRPLPFSLDLTDPIKRATEKDQTLNTPSTVNIWMMNEALKWMLANGGEKGMDTLVNKHAQTVWDWVARKDFADPYVDDPAYRSQATVTVTLDESVIQADNINAALKATGKPNLADGIKKYSSVPGNVVRISCFPFVDIHGGGEHDKLLQTVDYIIEHQ